MCSLLMAFQLLVLSCCECGWQWFCWRWRTMEKVDTVSHWRWYLVSSILMVAAVIFIQMMFAWKKGSCFCKGIPWCSSHLLLDIKTWEALPQLWRIFCAWKRVRHCFLESHWKPWLLVRFSSLQPKAGGQVFFAVLSLTVSGTLPGVSMKQLFLSLTEPSGGEGLSDGGPRLRHLVPSALPSVSGPLLMPGSSPAPKRVAGNARVCTVPDGTLTCQGISAQGLPLPPCACLWIRWHPEFHGSVITVDF